MDVASRSLSNHDIPYSVAEWRNARSCYNAESSYGMRTKTRIQDHAKSLRNSTHLLNCGANAATHVSDSVSSFMCGDNSKLDS